MCRRKEAGINQPLLAFGGNGQKVTFVTLDITRV